MPAKPKRTQLTPADLHRFGQLHAEIALAQERLAHARTRAQLAQAIHEGNVLRLAAEHNANLRGTEAKLGEAQADLDASKSLATDFAKALGESYAVDLKTHAVDPLTGSFVRLNEGDHG